jgi:hypothetical protein
MRREPRSMGVFIFNPTWNSLSWEVERTPKCREENRRHRLGNFWWCCHDHGTVGHTRMFTSVWWSWSRQSAAQLCATDRAVAFDLCTHESKQAARVCVESVECDDAFVLSHSQRPQSYMLPLRAGSVLAVAGALIYASCCQLRSTSTTHCSTSAVGTSPILLRICLYSYDQLRVQLVTANDSCWISLHDRERGALPRVTDLHSHLYI